ncbi:MAG: IPT/TIG domain-containing protein [Planctomycetota bacterium]|jgi:hypothetical protein
MRILLTLLLSAGALFAQEIDSVKPLCGAEGDLVLIKGSDFADAPAVDFNGTEADVIKSNDTRILVRVPEGAETGAITVDAVSTEDDFTVVEDGAPVVLHVSTDTAVAGQRVLMIGRRLGGDVEFLDGDGEVAASAELTGRKRFAYFKVPDDLATGDYTLNVVNGELESGDCSPSIEVVEEGDPAIDSISPEDQLPGRTVTIEGTNLGAFGRATVTWTDGDTVLESKGFSNGFGKIWTHVPLKAEGGTTYDVAIVIDDDTSSESVEYAVGSVGAPEIDEIAPETAPAGSLILIKGSNLVVFGEDKPTVTMTMGDTELDADVVGAMPGFGDHPEALLVKVPKDADDGTYDVTVTVGDQTSDAAEFEVGLPEMSVDSMSPDSQGTKGTWKSTTIEGSGFGFWGKLEVVWVDGDDKERNGFLVFRTDEKLEVIPPGGKFKPLAEGTYDVYVKRGDDKVLAGEYTVE